MHEEWIAAFNQIPHCGLKTASLFEVLAVVDACDQIPDKRILGITSRGTGRVLVRTGEMKAPLHGLGQWVLVERVDDGGWIVSDVTEWRS